MSQGPAEGRAGAFPGYQACLQSSRNCTVTVSPVPSRVLEDCPFPLRDESIQMSECVCIG